MKRKRRTKVWLAGLLGAVFIGMSGACGGETENEPVDRSMTITEDVMRNPKDLEESDEQAVIAGIISTPEEEAEVTKDIVSEPTATPVLTMAPTSIPKPTLEPTSTPAPTSEPTISSFDSIYKNKIAYAIIRILKDKERIILTHKHAAG